MNRKKIEKKLAQAIKKNQRINKKLTKKFNEVLGVIRVIDRKIGGVERNARREFWRMFITAKDHAWYLGRVKKYFIKNAGE